MRLRKRMSELHAIHAHYPTYESVWCCGGMQNDGLELTGVSLGHTRLGWLIEKLYCM